MTAFGLRTQCLVLSGGPMIFIGRKAPKWKDNYLPGRHNREGLL
jgi:hypothetical protein